MSSAPLPVLVLASVSSSPVLLSLLLLARPLQSLLPDSGETIPFSADSGTRLFTRYVSPHLSWVPIPNSLTGQPNPSRSQQCHPRWPDELEDSLGMAYLFKIHHRSCRCPCLLLRLSQVPQQLLR